MSKSIDIIYKHVKFESDEGRLWSDVKATESFGVSSISIDTLKKYTITDTYIYFSSTKEVYQRSYMKLQTALADTLAVSELVSTLISFLIGFVNIAKMEFKLVSSWLNNSFDPNMMPLENNKCNAINEEMMSKDKLELTSIRKDDNINPVLQLKNPSIKRSIDANVCNVEEVINLSFFKYVCLGRIFNC